MPSRWWFRRVQKAFLDEEDLIGPIGLTPDGVNRAATYVKLSADLEQPIDTGTILWPLECSSWLSTT